MRSIRMLTAALLSVAGLVAIGATTESASASSLSLTASHSTVMKFETFTLSGKLITPKVRTVKLQYKSGDKWVDKTSKSTNADGSFYFSTYTGVTRIYRYYAPKSGTSATIIGSPKKITLVVQKVTAYISPNPVAYFCAAPNFNGTVNAVVTVTPARGGRGITFTTPNGVLENSANFDGHGHAVVPFNLTKVAGTYKVTVTADAYNGASATSTATPASITVNHYNIFCP